MVAFAVLLSAISYRFWLESSIAVSLLLLFPRQRTWLLPALNMISWMIFDVIPSSLIEKAAIARGMAAPNYAILRALAFMSVLIFCWGSARVVKRASFATRWGILLVISLIGISLFPLIPLSGYLSLWYWAFFWALGRMYWYFAFLIVGDQELREKPLASIFFFTPFWAPSLIAPIPLSRVTLERTSSRDQVSYTETMRSGLRLLSWVTAMALASSALRHFLFQLEPLYFTWLPWSHFFSLGLPSHVSIGNALVPSSFPLAIRWLLVMVLAFEFLLRNAVVFGIPVALARASGFSLLRNTYHPLRATNFANFLRRNFYYYNEVLVEIFFPAAWAGLSGIQRSKSLRIWLTVFASTCLGGFYFHTYTLHFYLASDPGLQSFLEGSVSTFIYYVPLGILTATSVLFRHQKRSLLPHVPAVFFIFPLYGILTLTFIRYGLPLLLPERMRYIFSFFGH